MKAHLFGACAMSLALAATNAQAQVERQGASEVEEVVVTSRKREESLQDAPVAVTAFTAQALERAGVLSLGGVAVRTPGYGFSTVGDIKRTRQSLRGITSAGNSAGADPAIGYYVDEIYEGQGAGTNLDLYDIAQIEVLRGPQGTLFGRNTIAGVVSLTTQRPSQVFEGSIIGRVTNYDGRRLAASVSGPILEGLLAGKISAVSDRRGGIAVNETLNTRTNNRDSWSTRGQLLFTPGDSTELLLTADYRHVDQSPLSFDTFRYEETALTPQALDAFGLPRNADPFDRKVQGDTPSVEKFNGYGVSSVLKTDLGGINLTSITSYRRHSYFSRADTDNSPITLLYDGDPERVWRASQEVRIDGEFGALQWLAGVYYFRQSSINNAYFEVGEFLSNFLTTNFGLPIPAGARVGATGDLDTTSVSAFASGTWTFSDQWDLTIGGRYTQDRKEIDFVQVDPLGSFGGSLVARAKDSWGEFTPNFNLRYRPTPDLTAYISAAKGFKSGGFNDAIGNATNGVAFDPETLWNYETGLKIKALEGRLNAAFAVYRMEWDNIQLNEDDLSTPLFDPIIKNGGAARNQGIEAEVNLRVTDNLTLGAQGTMIDAKFKNEINGVRPGFSTPNYTFGVSAEQRWPLAGGEVTAYGELLQRGRSRTNDGSDAISVVKSYGLVNLRLSWVAPDERWRVTAFVDNLTERDYAVGTVRSAQDNPFIGQDFVILNEPRTYGLELKASF